MFADWALCSAMKALHLFCFPLLFYFKLSLLIVIIPFYLIKIVPTLFEMITLLPKHNVEYNLLDRELFVVLSFVVLFLTLVSLD